MTGVTEEETLQNSPLPPCDLRDVKLPRRELASALQKEKKEVMATTAPTARGIHLFNQRHLDRYKRESQ